MRQQLHRFRPMSISDIFDETIDLYRSKFVLFVGIAAAISVPFLFVQSALQPRYAPGENVHILLNYVFTYTAAVYIPLWIITQIVTGAITFAVSESYLGRRASIASCYRKMFSSRVFFPFFGAVLLKSALVTVPIFSFLSLVTVVMFSMAIGYGAALTPVVLLAVGVPLGIGALFISAYLWLRFVLVEPSLIVEMKGTMGSLGRARRLVQGNMLKAFAVISIAYAVTFMISGMLLMPFLLVIWSSAFTKHAAPSSSLTAIYTALSVLLNTVLMPIVPITVVLLYYDVRIRKEGFDLEVLASELGLRGRETEESLEQTVSPETTGNG